MDLTWLFLLVPIFMILIVSLAAKYAGNNKKKGPH